MFELTFEEAEECSRSQFVTLNASAGRGSNIKYRPKAFTEQGIYMLMTVLKGELAVTQSITVIRLFRQKTDDNEHDRKFEKIVVQLTDPSVRKSALFFLGEMYDAFNLLIFL